MKKITKTALKKQLQKHSQGELVELIMRLNSAVPEASDFIIIELSGEEYALELLSKARKKIRNEFFPDRGLGRLSLSTAKAAIRDFRRVCRNPMHYIDLQLYYIECGVEFTNTYGDIDEPFYNSMERMYRDVINALNTLSDDSMTQMFYDRLKAIVEDTSDIGWGFHDGLRDTFSELAYRS